MLTILAMCPLLPGFLILIASLAILFCEPPNRGGKPKEGN